jgi:SAM domain (Sterile alpha motif)
MLARRNRPGRQVMSTTAEWLTSLGMSEYAERFAENDIDFTILEHFQV